MQYIHLNNDSFILNTSKGMKNVTRRSFNFNKIKKLLQEGCEEEQILPLLAAPDLPDGIFEVYEVDGVGLFIKNRKHTNTGYATTNCKWLLMPGAKSVSEDSIDPSMFLGVYASEESVLVDWPEYAI